MKRFIRFAGRDRICRLPTSEEWDQLVDIVRKKDFQLHWQNMFSWVDDVTADTDALSRMLRGYFTVLNYRHYSPSGRRPNLGFRPAFDPLSNSEPRFWEFGQCFGDLIAEDVGIPNNLLFDYLELQPV